mmetsp:Transcript_50613/g.140253  ORF Transcript_50613/g.140253 Transcript_50613/m.140253 type:complete len:340 (+) Transcript_50613:578-1597(+)
MVHLHGEDLARARVRRGVRRQEHHLLARLHHALLHAAGQDIAHALDLVDPRDRHAHGRADRTLRHTAELVQHIIDRVHMDRLAAELDVLALPPPHVLRLLQQVVSHPPRDREHRRALLDEVLLPTHLHQHALHLVGNLVVARLLVSGGVTIHLVHANRNLFHAQQVDQPGVLPSLALDLPGLVVPLRDRRREVAIRRHHDQRHVRLRRACDHVLDEVPVARRVDDSVMPLFCVEFFGRASDGHAALALLLLPVHVESERKTALSEALRLSLQLLQLALRQPAQLEDQAARRRALAAVDMAADDDGEVLLLRVRRHPRWLPRATSGARCKTPRVLLEQKP